MRLLFLLVVTALCTSTSLATDVLRRLPIPPTSAPSQPRQDAKLVDIKAVTSAGPGQAGYVHYFLLTYPDKSLEYHVGIELDDQRIAWSFPNLGVTVVPFEKRGVIDAGGVPIIVEHLHGIRPFASEVEMRTLQAQLAPRVALWIDDGIPYCLMRQPGGDFCLSCGDFVVRILYPGPRPLTPALPRDFARVTGSGIAYNTDDLLLYLVGLSNLPDRQSMLGHLAKLDIPAVMREDILYMIGTQEADNLAVTAMATQATSAVAPTTQKPAAAPPPAGRRVAIRRPQSRKL